MQINPDKKARRQSMKKAALNAAETKENIADIINYIIDELIKSKFKLPSFKRLLRLARAARSVINNDNYGKIFNELTDEQKKLIDTMVGLIKPADDENTLTWLMLKLEPKKPTTNNIKGYIQYVNNLKI
jgi:hypothetical protein